MKIVKQFISFGIIGFINTFLNIGIYWALIHFGLNYLIANFIGFTITVFISYILNTIFTFKNNDNKKWSIKILIKSYASYFFTGIVLNSTLLYVFNDMLKINVYVTPIINLCFTVPINFIINKFWAYRS